MPRSIPPLNPLYVFAVVARRLNLTAAAQELHVTQSAVSRQIAALERYTGMALLHRQSRGVALTPAGQEYAHEVIPAFERLAAATAGLMKPAPPNSLRIHTYTTFAAKWLIPRLTRFREQHPGIEVVISTGVPAIDFERDTADLAIQYGDGDWPRTRADLLLPDELEPVCSPRYLAGCTGAKRDPARLLRGPLLGSHYRKNDWNDWLAAKNLQDQAAGAPRTSFSTSVLTWQAAVDSLGVAMGQSALLQAEFAAGLLVRPFADPLHTGKGHYLLRPALQRHSRKVAVFRQWLLREAGGQA